MVVVVVVVSGAAAADGNDDEDGIISSSLIVVVAVNGGGVDSSGGGTGIATAIGRSPSYSIGGALGSKPVLRGDADDDDDDGAGAGDGGGALGLNRKLYMTTLSRLVPRLLSPFSLLLLAQRLWLGPTATRRRPLCREPRVRECTKPPITLTYILSAT